MRHPVFIVGSPRSGTSILVDCMIAAGYKGFREGNFLSVWNAIERMVDRHFQVFADGNPQNLVSRVDPAALKTRLFAVLAEEVARLNPDAPWFDKTGNPEMILTIPMLRAVWPEAVFIFAKRRAIENILSRLKKFPGHTFKYHCADWARTMSVWRSTRDGLPDGCYVEVDQQDMIQHPEAVAETLATLLRLPPQAAEAIASTLRVNRPQETDKGSAQRRYSLKTTDWPPELIGIFEELCRTEMIANGYSDDEKYWKE